MWKNGFPSFSNDFLKILICLYSNGLSLPFWENRPTEIYETLFLASLDEYLQIWFGDLGNFILRVKNRPKMETILGF